MRLIRFTIPLVAAALASCAAFGGVRVGREAEPRNVGRLNVSPDSSGERPTGRRLFWADRH